MFGHISVTFTLPCKLRRSLLPELAKHAVLTMLYNPNPVSLEDFNAWFETDTESRTY